MKEKIRLPKRDEKLSSQIDDIKKQIHQSKSQDEVSQLKVPSWHYLCNGKMKGGCIVFGGWMKIIPDTGDKYAYCAYGGLGVGGWNHECSIYSIYSDIQDLYSSSISCMLVSGHSLAGEDPMPAAATDCVFYDKHSTIVGIASTDAGVAALVGGTVKWKNK